MEIYLTRLEEEKFTNETLNELLKGYHYDIESLLNTIHLYPGSDPFSRLTIAEKELISHAYGIRIPDAGRPTSISHETEGQLRQQFEFLGDSQFQNFSSLILRQALTRMSLLKQFNRTKFAYARDCNTEALRYKNHLFRSSGSIPSRKSVMKQRTKKSKLKLNSDHAGESKNRASVNRSRGMAIGDLLSTQSRCSYAFDSMWERPPVRYRQIGPTLLIRDFNNPYPVNLLQAKEGILDRDVSDYSHYKNMMFAQKYGYNNGGHWVTFELKDGELFLYNDDHVAKVSEHEMMDILENNTGATIVEYFE